MERKHEIENDLLRREIEEDILMVPVEALTSFGCVPSATRRVI